jgi:hypothetical protein
VVTYHPRTLARDTVTIPNGSMLPYEASYPYTSALLWTQLDVIAARWSSKADRIDYPASRASLPGILILDDASMAQQSFSDPIRAWIAFASGSSVPP